MKPDTKIACPVCQEDRLVERDGRLIYCNVCGKISTAVSPAVTPPIAGTGSNQ